MNNPVFNFLALMIGISVCGAIWGAASPASDAMAMATLGPPPMQVDGAFEGLDTFFSIIWLGLRLLFWLLVGLAGTGLVLFTLASVGVLTWVVQQLCRGFVYVSSTIRNQIEEMTAGPKPEEAVVAKTAEGKPVAIKQVLADFQDRITKLEEANAELRLRAPKAI